MLGWNEFFVPKMFYCELFETEYTVEFEYFQQAQSTRVLKRNYIAPIIDTTYDPTIDANDGANDPVTAYPKDRYVYPRDTERYRYVAAHHSFRAVFRDIINGTINSSQVDHPDFYQTKACMTKLVDPRKDRFPVPDLIEAMKSMFEDNLFSMFNRPHFLAVSWAADPSRISGDRGGDETTMYPCVRSKLENRLRYKPQELGAVYGASVILAAVAVSIGTFSVMRSGGMLKNTRFSSIATLLQHCGYNLDSYKQPGLLETKASEK